MSDISLRYEEREGIGKFLIGSVYSQSVSANDTITVYKKDYMGVVLRIKTDSAVTVTLDSVAANLEVPEEGVDTFISVGETIATFTGAGETVVNLADTLTKKWAVAFPYLRFKFSAAATIDFVATATTDIGTTVDDLKRATELAAKDLVITSADPPIVVASGDEVSVDDLTIEAGARCYVYGVLRVFGENFIKGELNVIGDVEFAGGV